MRKIVFIAVCLSILLLGGGKSAYCYEDGFGPAKKISGKHFTVYLAPSLDSDQLAMSLDYRRDVISGAGGSGDQLADMLDGLFDRVCEILDMRLFSYQGTIKVCRDAAHLNAVAERLFDQSCGLQSFFVADLNSIYVDPEHFTQWIVGHEMGHAVTCHYFVVPPPAKISEVLCGYVEYQLRKK